MPERGPVHLSQVCLAVVTPPQQQPDGEIRNARSISKTTNRAQYYPINAVSRCITTPRQRPAVIHTYRPSALTLPFSRRSPQKKPGTAGAVARRQKPRALAAPSQACDDDDDDDGLLLSPALSLAQEASSRSRQRRREEMQ